MAQTRYFIPARMQTGGAPEVRDMKYATGQAFKKGALLTVSAAGEVTECGADPTALIGVAGTMPGFGPGRNLANDSEVVVRTGVEDTVSVILANRAQIFSGIAVGAADAVQTPAQTHIDESYGVKKLADGTWVIDMTETTTPVVYIEDIDVGTGTFLFKFLESRLKRP